MSMYVVERRNGSPALLKKGGNGYYEVIAYGDGPERLDDLMSLSREANLWWEDEK